MAYESIEQDIDLSGLGAEAEIEMDPNNPGAPAGGTDDEVVIVDDRAPDDRGKPTLTEYENEQRAKGKDPNAEIPEDEREQYSERVKQRIAEMNFKAHAARREAEDAIRERDAAVAIAQNYAERLKTVNQSYSNDAQFTIKALRDQSTAMIEMLKRELTQAHMENDSARIADLNQRMMHETLKLQQVNNYQPVQLHDPDFNNDWQATAPRFAREPAAKREIETDPVTENWLKRNPWFRADPVMTARAGDIDTYMRKQGHDPLTLGDDYYKTLDRAMRREFPDYPWEDGEEKGAPPVVTARASRVAAPGRRRDGKGRAVLTQSEANLARRLGLTPQQYWAEKQKIR